MATHTVNLHGPRRVAGARLGEGSGSAAARVRERVSERDVRVVRAGTTAIAVAMVLVALAMWVAVPLAVLYGGSMLVGTVSDFGIYGLMFATVAVAMFPGMKLLALLQTWQCRLAGTIPARARSAWLKSQCDDRARKAPTLLDTVMSGVVVLAWVAMAVWFFGFAHMQLPG